MSGRIPPFTRPSFTRPRRPPPPAAFPLVDSRIGAMLEADAMLKAIIFDLDGCLAAPDEPGRELLDPVFAALHRTNGGRYTAAEMERIQADCWQEPLDRVFAKYAMPDAMRGAAREAHLGLRITAPMHGYGDLHLLADFGVPLFLVTSGFRELQQSKIDALGLARYFKETQIDEIDRPGRRGKKGLFQDIMSRHHLAPAEIMVVGDNPGSEIAAGNELGIPTVQTLRPGVLRSETARHHVDGLASLLSLTGGPPVV